MRFPARPLPISHTHAHDALMHVCRQNMCFAPKVIQCENRSKSIGKVNNGLIGVRMVGRVGQVGGER